MQRIDLRGVESAEERLRNTLCERALRPVYAKAPVALALVEVMFLFEDSAIDTEHLKSLRYQ